MRAQAGGLGPSHAATLGLSLAPTGETVLHFLVAGLWETAPSLLNIDGDFPVLLSHLPPAPQGATDDERKALALVPQGKLCDSHEEHVRKLRTLLTVATGDGAEKMRGRLSVELEVAAADAARLRARYVAVTQQFRDLLHWLGEDVGAQPDKIFNAASGTAALARPWCVCAHPLRPVLFRMQVGDFIRNVAEESSRMKQAADAAAANESRARREAEVASARAAAALAKALQSKEAAASPSVAASTDSAAQDASPDPVIPAAPSAPPVMRRFESAPESRALIRSVAGTVMAALANEAGARRRRRRGLGGALALQAILALQSAAQHGVVAGSDAGPTSDSGRRAPMTRAVSLQE